MNSATLSRCIVSKVLTNNNVFKYGNVARNVRAYSAAEAAKETFKFIKVSKIGEKQNIGLIELNRPKVLNALCNGLIKEVSKALNTLDRDSKVGAVILTGSDKVFAVGADIKELAGLTFSKATSEDSFDNSALLATTKKPVIAAVNGYALGGGCELAMMCDFIYAGDKAKFGQPEILLGIIPGAGGTQRLPKTVGKSKAMEIVLTGDQITAQEAEKMGLISKVFPADQLLNETLKLAEKIANHSNITNIIAKEAVNTSLETTLKEGLHFEQRLSNACFATKDQKEGMAAFIQKRKPNFTNE